MGRDRLYPTIYLSYLPFFNFLILFIYLSRALNVLTVKIVDRSDHNNVSIALVKLLQECIGKVTSLDLRCTALNYFGPIQTGLRIRNDLFRFRIRNRNFYFWIADPDPTRVKGWRVIIVLVIASPPAKMTKLCLKK